MRIYLEAHEQTNDNPEFVRIDVTGKSKGEQDAILVSLKDFMDGVNCVFSRHFCYHDTGGRNCESELC